jgi:hypothetical protein
MRPPLRLGVVLAVVVLTTGACGLPSEPPDATPTPATSSPDPSTSSSSPAPTSTTPGAPGSGTASATSSTGTGAALPDDLRTRPAVSDAIADTARREGVPPAQVVIAAWSPVTWTDGSLGCPVEGMSYTQALVEGELLILRVGGSLFQYHARSGGPFAYCATPSAGYSVSG